MADESVENQNPEQQDDEISLSGDELEGILDGAELSEVSLDIDEGEIGDELSDSEEPGDQSEIDAQDDNFIDDSIPSIDLEANADQDADADNSSLEDLPDLSDTELPELDDTLPDLEADTETTDTSLADLEEDLPTLDDQSEQSDTDSLSELEGEIPEIDTPDTELDLPDLDEELPDLDDTLASAETADEEADPDLPSLDSDDGTEEIVAAPELIDGLPELDENPENDDVPAGLDELNDAIESEPLDDSLPPDDTPPASSEDQIANELGALPDDIPPDTEETTGAPAGQSPDLSEDEAIALSASEMDNILSDVDESQVIDLSSEDQAQESGTTGEDEEVISLSGEEFDSITKDLEEEVSDSEELELSEQSDSVSDSKKFEEEILKDAQVTLEKPTEQDSAGTPDTHPDLSPDILDEAAQQPEVPEESLDEQELTPIEQRPRGKVRDKELRELFRYLDVLLDSLPEKKITEFAESKYYDTYISIINRLGL